MNSRRLFAELKRRNVYKVAVAYAIVAWLLIQIATQLFPFFEIPNWAVRLVVLLIIIGFPIALVIAWAFELTPEGIKRTEDVDLARKQSRGGAWIYIVLIGVMMSVSLFFVGRYTARERKENSPLEKSIAVLPFESLSEDKANAYFAEGIQDEILTRLSKIGDLKVISRTSTQKYKSAPANLREIAQQLGVSNVLEGTVQKAADQVRVSVQLVNALNDSHLWAETYDRKLVDLFQVESDVAQKIAASLEAKLTGREKQDVAFVGTKNSDAYDAVLHALALRGSQQLEDSFKQREFLQHAVDLDRNYAQAWALLGGTDALLYFFPDSSAERKLMARTAVETALRLAPDLAETHTAMGIYKYYCLQDYDGALAEFGTALQHAPNDRTALYFNSLVLRRQGKLEDCIRVMKEAAVLDPLNEDIQINLGQTYRGMRRFDEARAIFDQVPSIAPNNVQWRYLRAESYLAQGDANKAGESVIGVKVSPLDPSFGTYLTLLAVRRQFDDMIAALSPLAETGKDIPPLFRTVALAALANLHFATGDRARALTFRTQAEQEIKAFLDQERFPPLAYDVFIQMEARFGDRDAFERYLRRMFDQTEKDKWQFPNSETTAAAGYMLLGDFDHALPLLQDALSRPGENSITPGYLRLDPIWDPIRNDSRFQKLANP
ncbi:MAG: tetratricopeptide repeat protein [Chthoniobacterales bacterium]